jgi:hypothetical protein
VLPSLVLVLAARLAPRSVTLTRAALAAPLTWQALANATYRSAFAPGGKAKLVNGVYSVPAAPGSATRLTIQLAPISMVGDLNGDAAQDAAVVLVTNPGGSGTFFALVAVINQNGTPAPLAPRLLGDRVLIHSIGIDHRQIQVALDTRSTHAPMTRRDTRSDRTFAVRGNRLVLIHESDRPISPVG